MSLRLFVLGTRLMVAAVVIQLFLAGLGIFAQAGFFWHGTVGAAVVFFLPLPVIVAGRVAHVSPRLLWMAGAVMGLVVLQSLLLLPYRMGAPDWLRAISALHVVNAFVIIWVSLELLERSRRLEKEARMTTH